MNKLACTTGLTLLLLIACCKAKPHEMSPMAGAAAPLSAGTSWTSIGEALFAQVKELTGVWDAPTRQLGTANISKPFVFGRAVIAEVWIIGKKITSTVLYVAHNELRADHYRGYPEQPHHLAARSLDPNDRDIHPVHFHRTKSRFTTWG